jgi:hypothetical protein
MCKQNLHILYTCIYNRGCWQINCPSIADLFCDWFNPLLGHGWVEVYMFIVAVKFYNRYSTILSTMSNMHALPFNGCDQCSLLVWYNTLSHFCWTWSQMKNKIYLLSPPPPKKKLAIFIQYEQPSSKCDKEKLGHVCLILYILAIDPGPCHLGIPPKEK